MEEDVNPKDEDGVDGRGVCGWDGWVCGLGAVGASSIFRLFQDFNSRNITVANATSSGQRFLHNLRRWSAAPWRGLRVYMSAWVSVGLPSRLDRVFAHRIRGLLVC